MAIKATVEITKRIVATMPEQTSWSLYASDDVMKQVNMTAAEAMMFRVLTVR